MLELTPKSVKSDIKSFNKVSDDHVSQAITQAKIQAKSDNIPKDDMDVYNLAVLNYARHILVVDLFTDYNVTNVSDLGNSEGIANPNTYDDRYYQAYSAIAYDSDGGIQTYNGTRSHYLVQ